MIVRIFAVWTVIVLLIAFPVVAQKGTGGLSDLQLGSGLKEALRVGTQNAVQLTGRLDGYFRNQAIKILMPKQLQFLETGLRTIGLGPQVDEFVLSMNRAAERAAPHAGQIFLDAISTMTFDDVRRIMTGGDTAATQYFKTRTSNTLTMAFRPVVDQAMHEVGVTRQYNELVEQYRSIPFAQSLAFDINGYVVTKALDGLFHVLGDEERKIRTNPAARVTNLLQQVFKR
jgi:Protein of unknown function (DUF4197)